MGGRDADRRVHFEARSQEPQPEVSADMSYLSFVCYTCPSRVTVNRVNVRRVLILLRRCVHAVLKGTLGSAFSTISNSASGAGANSFVATELQVIIIGFIQTRHRNHMINCIGHSKIPFRSKIVRTRKRRPYGKLQGSWRSST